MEKEVEEVKLVGSRYSLRRVSDGAGDSGMAWDVFDYDKTIENGEYVFLEDAKGLIRVGCGIRCGSISARSYSHQDWWQCSPVTEILEVNDEKTWVKFKTKNSVYIAESF